MEHKAKKNTFYSIMIVPHDAQGRPISFKVPAKWVYAAGWISLSLFLLVGSSLIYSTLVSRKLVNYADTLSKSQQQQLIINSFLDKTNKVNQAIDELAQEDNELRKLLGLKSWQSKIKLSTKSAVPDLSSLDGLIAERKKSFKELKDWVFTVRSKLASTPGSWPIRGQISSFFGYRAYPWRGFHSGIDIRAPYGSPIRATAPGRVAYIGWRNGYGKTVEIDHGNGVSTLFGHCSGYAVNIIGQYVRRGQIVGYVGTTGWATGSHLHYEVRRWDQPINPIAFLDLNLLTASRLWR